MSAVLNHKVPFLKMSGAGNDFVIIDVRQLPIELSPENIVKISNRKNVGCDQFVILKKDDACDVWMEIYNADGSRSGACGNATRCVAAILMEQLGKTEVKIKTTAGVLKCWKDGDLIAVDMGMPRFSWQEIPLAQEFDSENLKLYGMNFACANFGNPHAVSFVESIPTDEVFFKVGPAVENDEIFPSKVNVEFAHIVTDDLIEVRVWERGAGETLACGSGACAVGVLAIKKNLIKSKKVTTRFKGGDLTIEWRGDSVIMTGNYQKIFSGILDESFLV